MRKYIDILNEFVADDFSGNGDGGGSGYEMIEVTNISWYDRDGDEIYSDDLPTEVTLPVDADKGDVIDYYISAELSKRYGDKLNASALLFDYRYL